MGMMDEFNRIEDGRLLRDYIRNFNSFIANMDVMLGNVKAFVAKYPADAAELNGYLAAAKVAIQAVVDKY